MDGLHTQRTSRLLVNVGAVAARPRLAFGYPASLEDQPSIVGGGLGAAGARLRRISTHHLDVYQWESGSIEGQTYLNSQCVILLILLDVVGVDAVGFMKEDGVVAVGVGELRLLHQRETIFELKRRHGQSKHCCGFRTRLNSRRRR